jgi:hypothetical protein
MNPFPTDFFGYNVAEAIKNGTFPNKSTAEFRPMADRYGFFDSLKKAKSENRTHEINGEVLVEWFFDIENNDPGKVQSDIKEYIKHLLPDEYIQ